MLQLQFASAVVTLSMDMGQFNRDFATLQAKLTRFPRTVDVAIHLETNTAISGLAALRQQFDEFRRQAQQGIKINVESGGGFGGGGGGGGFGGGGRGGFGGGGFGGDPTGESGTGGGGTGGGGGTEGPMARAAAARAAAEKQAQELATIEDRYFMKDYNRRVQAAAAAASAEQRKGQELLSIEDRWLQREYQGRVAHERRLQAETVRAAAERLAAADRLNRDLTDIEDRYLMSEYRGRVAHQRRLQAEAARAAAATAATSRQRKVDFGVGVAQGFGAFAAYNPAMAAGQAVAGSIIAVKDAAVDAVKVAADLQEQFITLGRLSGKSAGEIDVLKEGLFDLALRKDVSMGMSDIVTLATAVGRAGITSSGDILKFTEVLAKMKTVAGDMDPEALATGFIQLSKNMGLGAEHAEGLASAITLAGDSTTAGTRQVFEITKRLSVLNLVAGATAPQIISLGSFLADLGVRAETGGTAMIQWMMRMETASKSFADVIGITDAEFRKGFGEDPLNMLRRFGEALKGLDQFARAETLAKMGIESSRQRQVLAQLIPSLDRAATATATYAEEMERSGHLTAGAASQGESFNAAMRRLETSATRLKDAFGAPFLDPLTLVIDKFASGVQVVGQFAIALQQLKSPMIAIPHVLAMNAVMAQVAAAGGAGQKTFPKLPEKVAVPGAGLPELPKPEMTVSERAGLKAGTGKGKAGKGMGGFIGEVSRETVLQKAHDAINEALAQAREEENLAVQVSRGATAKAQAARGGPAAAAAADAETKAQQAAEAAGMHRIAAEKRLMDLEKMQAQQADFRKSQDIIAQGKAGLGKGIGMVRDWRKAAMQVAGEGLGLVADKLVPDKPKERLTIGRSVMDYAEKVTESVLNQDVDEAAKKTAEATTKSAIVLNDIKTLMQNGGALIQGGAAFLGGGRNP